MTRDEIIEAGPDDWRPIPGYDGIYEASGHGQIRDSRTGEMRKLSLRKDDNPRFVLALSSPSSPLRQRMVHQLVLEAFIGPRPDGMIACHRNDVDTDNRIANLYWGTYSDNAWDKVANGNHHYGNRAACKNGHEFTDENTRIRETSVGVRRDCLTCKREAHAAGVERERAERAAAGILPMKDRPNCKRGHPLSGDNLKMQKGGRSCRACAKITQAAYQARRKAKAEESSG